MECIKCSQKSSISMKHLGELCKTCFVEVIEKRVRKELRTKNPLKKNNKIVIINNASKESAVSEYLLKKIIKGLPVDITIKKSSKLNLPSKTVQKYDKIIIPWSLEDEAAEFLELLFNKTPITKFSKKSIKLLKVLSEEEITMYTKIKKLKYNKQSKKKKSKVKIILDTLEKKYHGYKFSLLNSTRNIKGILRKK